MGETSNNNVARIGDWPGDWFEQATQCLICSSERLEPFVDGVQDWFFACVPGQFAFLRCAECHSLNLAEQLSQDHISKAYDRYYTRNQPEEFAPSGVISAAWRAMRSAYIRSRIARNGSASDDALAWLVERFPARRLEIDVRYRFVPSHQANVLDYGSGNGAFLDRVAALGCEVTGVEFDAEAAAFSDHKILTPLEAHGADWDARFDLITANHVLEHVSDPQRLLTCIKRWLKPDGLLFLELPNAEATGLGRYGRFWRGLEAPRHLSVPSLSGLEMALQRAGFDPPEFIDRGFGGQGMLDQSATAANSAKCDEPALKCAAALSGPELLTMLVRSRG